MGEIMEYTANDHTFMVCAYKESEYLEACIQSLLAQTVKSKIMISTATPNALIEGVAEKYGLKVVVNTGEGGNANDWNYAYSQAETPLVTLAHQDDLYDPAYTETFLQMINGAKKPLLFFTDYNELRGEVFVHKNRLLRVKRILLFPLRARCLQGWYPAKWFSLAFGCAINCPSVGFIKENLPEKIFVPGFKSDADWEAWVKLMKLKGSFVYTRKELVSHRIHPGSQTSAVLGENIRVKEDYEMFCRMWPKWVAKILIKFYAKSEKSNRL